MKKRNLFSQVTLVASLLLLSIGSHAQLAMTRSTFTGTYTPISTGTGATASTASGDDGSQINVPLGFTFNYLGTNYTSVQLSTNGWLSFNNTTSGSYINGEMYTTSGPNNALYPWFDDLTFGVNSVSGAPSLLYQTQGTVGSQTFTAQWTNVCAYRTSGGTALNFQVILYEGTNVIEFRYGNKTVGTYITGQSASIGIEGVTGGAGNYMDAMTGSSRTGHYYLSESQWPQYYFRFTPGAPTVLPGGTYNVGIGQTYPNLTEAVCDIQQRGISGAVTLNLVDAVYDTSAAGGQNMFPIIIGPVTGTSGSNTITISKTSGTAAIRWGGNIPGSTSGAMIASAAAVNGSNVEPIFALCGADYVTVNNIDIRGNVGFQNADHGIGVYNNSATDGSQNNTFSNFSVIMRRGNTGSRGAVMNTVVTPTAASGANSNNIFRDFSITNVYAGLQLTGNATFPDLSTQVVRTVCGTFNTIGDPNTSNDIGGGTSQTYGIQLINQSAFVVAGNSIRNVTGSATQTDGIVVTTFQGNCVLGNNRIQGVRNSSTTSTTGIAGIRMSHTTTGVHMIAVFNNTVSDITSAYTGAATSARTLKGIFINGTGGLNTQSYQIYNNSVSIDGSASPTLSSSCFEVNTVTGPVVTVANNIFANFTSAQTAPAVHYVFVTPSASAIGNTGSVSNNNDLFVANDAGVSGFVGGSSANYTSLANWQAAMSQDAASLSVNPQYLSQSSDLHSAQISLNGAGMAPPIPNTVDNDCVARTPDNDIGAFVINACSGTPTAGTITGITAVCSGSGTTLTLTGASTGAGITYQWASSLTNGGPYTTLLGNSNTQATGPLTATTYYVVGVGCSVSGQAATTAQFTVVVNPLPTVTATPSSATYCTGGNPVAIAASGASTYSWLPVTGLSTSTSANVNASPSSTTTYTVTGTDGNGCVGTATAAITVAAGVIVDSVTASSSAVCPGDSASMIVYSRFNTAPYCQPVYSTGTGLGDYVSLVQLGSINNASVGASAPYYTFYAPTATTTTTLVAGSTYTITLTPGTYNINDLAAWIDFNQNGVLNDASEKLGEQDNVGAAPATASFVFTVPLTAYNGTTRLRVRDMDHSGTNDMDPCAAQSAWGETEDYTVTIVGGVDPFTFSWTPSTFLSSTTNDTVNVNGITSTTEYFASVTAQSGCSATDSITVSVNALPAVIANASANPICAGDSLNLYGSGAVSYVWNNSVVDSVTFLPAVADTFIVVGTDANGCVNSDSLILTINPLPVVALSGNNLVCSGDSTLLTGSSGGTSQWYLNGVAIVGATSNTYYATTAGVYNMTKTNLNGCTDSASTGITVTVVLPPTVSVSGNSVICNGDSTTLTASGANTYTWVNGPAAASNTVMPTADSTFWVVGLDATATCSDSAMFMVTVNPTYTIPQNVHLCFGDSVTVGSNTYYSAGVYNDTMSTVNGCDSVYITTVTIDTAVLSSTQSVTICSGDSVVVGSSVYTTAGTYMDSLTSTMGCDSIVTTTVVVTAPVTTSQSVTVCFGDSYTIGSNTYTASGTYSDTLSNVVGCDSVVVTTLTVSPQITSSQTINACNVDTVFVGSSAYTTSGVYIDTLTSINGCDSIVTSNINFGGLSVTVSTTNFGGTLVASPSGLNYQWMNCQDNTTIISATMQSYTPSANGQFAVIVSDTSGCVDTSSCVSVTTVGVEETVALNEMSVYPNPNNGLFTVSIPNADYNAMSMEVVSIDGKVIYSDKFSNVSGTFTNEIDMTNAANGTYFLRVTADGTTTVMKVVRAE